MSKYTENQTEYRDSALLVECLQEMGIKQVDVHKTAQPLIGYHGDKRAETAEIIIPRKVVGRASNDIGFKLGANGSYTAIISEYDSATGYDAKWQAKLKATYAERGIIQKAKQKGCTFAGKKILPSGKIQLQFVMS